jgi:hypothetical protein
MEIRVEPKYASVTLHHPSDIQSSGFPVDTDTSRQAFVCLEIGEGTYGKDRQQIRVFLTPSQAEEMLVKLTDATATAYGVEA